jgi:hypothetical protein
MASAASTQTMVSAAGRRGIARHHDAFHPAQIVRASRPVNGAHAGKPSGQPANQVS